mmetsp:Transcript_17115/g.42226  ORF Transcript_17115/g.42226 Transcript_17115/m.42226 type:complete len:270 (-) Transcript_17115:98-907(-)
MRWILCRQRPQEVDHKRTLRRLLRDGGAHGGSGRRRHLAAAGGEGRGPGDEGHKDELLGLCRHCAGHVRRRPCSGGEPAGGGEPRLPVHHAQLQPRAVVHRRRSEPRVAAGGGGVLQVGLPAQSVREAPDRAARDPQQAGGDDQSRGGGAGMAGGGYTSNAAHDSRGTGEASSGPHRASEAVLHAQRQHGDGPVVPDFRREGHHADGNGARRGAVPAEQQVRRHPGRIRGDYGRPGRAAGDEGLPTGALIAPLLRRHHQMDRKQPGYHP